ncbi:MAG: uncharacterized protein KVP18_004585 [Porospora cf. gigantea A]|uniref:uncharacterized protein n=1 Tax=Porospora cf. gigantea A TaxID=2853593 RepID=UPI003559A665|nr:MAG: hypothetical protein KVP18_004585 [Porospora cf. gigantea A]
MARKKQAGLKQPARSEHNSFSQYLQKQPKAVVLTRVSRRKKKNPRDSVQETQRKRTLLSELRSSVKSNTFNDRRLADDHDRVKLLERRNKRQKKNE